MISTWYFHRLLITLIKLCSIKKIHYDIMSQIIFWCPFAAKYLICIKIWWNYSKATSEYQNRIKKYSFVQKIQLFNIFFFNMFFTNVFNFYILWKRHQVTMSTMRNYPSHLIGLKWHSPFILGIFISQFHKFYHLEKTLHSQCESVDII